VPRGISLEICHFAFVVQRDPRIGSSSRNAAQITSGVGPFITVRARERQAYTKREQFPTRHDKAVRAQSIRGRMELDGLYAPARAPWLPDLKAELLAFPTGKHDDQVDALGLVGQLLDKWAPGGVPKLEPGFFRPPRDYVEPYDRC